MLLNRPITTIFISSLLFPSACQTFVFLFLNGKKYLYAKKDSRSMSLMHMYVGCKKERKVMNKWRETRTEM